MRSLTALVGLAGLASGFASNLPRPSNLVLGVDESANLQSRPGPNRNSSCPFFFNTDPSFYTGTGVRVNQTTGEVSPSTFGSLTDSVHYQLSFKKMKWGRNTWIQHRFLSNVQDLPIENVKVCNMMFSITPNEAKYEPEFEGRVKYAPRIKGSQPSFEINNNVSLPWTNPDGSGQGFKTVCVTVPYVKAKGIQKVYFQYSSDVCSTSIVWKGWVEYDNPFNAIYPTSPDRCLASVNTTGPNTYNSVRTYRSYNLKVPISCGTCTRNVNCKGGKKNKPTKQ